MQVMLTKNISEGKAADAIFDACRANEQRVNKGGVDFESHGDGTHMATLHVNGEVVAIAIVDQFDC